MTLIKYRGPRPELFPTAPFEDFQNRIRKLFGDVAVPGFYPTETLAFTPAVEVVETDGSIVLTAELPGMKKEDLTIELEDNLLTLKGEKKTEREEKEARYHVWERSYGSFERSFTLPRSVDAKAIIANFEDGVLTVTMAKTAEAKGKMIEIKAK